MGDRRVDRVLGDEPLDSFIVVAGAVAGERSKLHLHFVGRLPGPNDHLTDPAHRLRIRAHHAENSAVMKDILGPDRLGPNPAFGKSDVLGNASREVVTNHQHIKVLVDRVDSKRPGRVGAGRQARWAARRS